MNAEIDALNEQITMLRQQAEGIKAMELSDMPKGGISRDMADMVAEVADLQMVCVQHVSDLIMKKQAVMDKIMQIDGSELRTILLLRYLQCLEWDDIAAKMHYSVRTVFSLHGEALQAFSQVCSKLQ